MSELNNLFILNRFLLLNAIIFFCFTAIVKSGHMPLMSLQFTHAFYIAGNTTLVLAIFSLAAYAMNRLTANKYSRHTDTKTSDVNLS